MALLRSFPSPGNLLRFKPADHLLPPSAALPLAFLKNSITTQSKYLARKSGPRFLAFSMNGKPSAELRFQLAGGCIHAGGRKKTDKWIDEIVTFY